MVTSDAMKARIDKAGRLVLPKPIRDELGLVEGCAIEVYVEDGRAIIEPAVVNWHVERRGRLSVLVPDGPVPQLTDAEVRDAIDEGRDPGARHLDPC
jgi:AbrB family looped-hinge helix DNA binding protein